MSDLDNNFEYSSSGYSVQEPIRYFSMSLCDPNIIRLINVGPDLVRLIHERLQQLVTIETFGYVILADYIQTNFLGRFNIYDLKLVKNYFQKEGDISKEDMTIIKVAFCRIFGALFCFGYDMVISTNLAREGTHSTIFFKLRDSQDYFYSLNYLSHKFICIAPHSTESIILINIPKVSVEEILKIIHLTWSPGIKSKQTLADDERSVTVVIALKLCGNPWTQAYYNSGKNTIQARSVILEIVRSLSIHKWRFAANINYTGNADSLFFFQWCPNLDLEDDKYCAIVLSRYDRLRCLQAPQGLQQSIKECINKYWYLGLQKTRDYHGVTEFKFGGCPWWSDGNDAVEARFFMSTLMGALKSNAWEVCGTFDLTRHNHDKTTFLLRHCRPQNLSHMCISFCKSNRIRLIVSSSEISEESELALTTRLNETIKQNWVSLGPRNFGKSIEWKLEGDPWECEGLYLDQTRCVYLLCLLLESIQPLGWRLIASADVSSKNIDSNDRGYSLVGKPEDVHTCSKFDYMPASTSVPNLEYVPKDDSPRTDRCSTSASNKEKTAQNSKYYNHNSFIKQETNLSSAAFLQQRHLSRSVPSVACVDQFNENNFFPSGHTLNQFSLNCAEFPLFNSQEFNFSNQRKIYDQSSNLSLHHDGDNLIWKNNPSHMFQQEHSVANDHQDLVDEEERLKQWNNGYESDGANVTNHNNVKRIANSGNYGRLSASECIGTNISSLLDEGIGTGASSSEELFAIEVRETTVTHSRSKANLLMGTGVNKSEEDKNRCRNDQSILQNHKIPSSQPIQRHYLTDGYRSEGSRSSPSHIIIHKHRTRPLNYNNQVNVCHHFHHHHHFKQQSPSIQNYLNSGRNNESCSTQSSSSSASAPPDYATCSGISPSYDTRLLPGSSTSCNPQTQHQHKQRKNNELYYVGEFYG
ncbi:unnamed protein product [Lepeophtheirus salmonis]|uniref:(salmon louse) hypothetical protein n=1 Tax=Lepeophtheirus salmonis TaxID=72036 RepID=A0A7R8CGL7_LEPSM|nr:unnamed protein product [Lepeophtheirus salmonis]CAF2816916.1 unnamed protein product [Lepeophtheirus salmonis]